MASRSPSHNPDCSKNRCRACLGYGVIVTGGPWYRACEGEEAERANIAVRLAEMGQERHATRWWNFKARRRIARTGRQMWQRWLEVA